MSILPISANLDQINTARPIFSLRGLAPFTTVPFAPTIVSRPSDLPDDLLCLSAAANDFVLHSEDEPDTDADATHATASWPNHILPMGDHASSPPDAIPAARTDASDPIDTLTFLSVDSDYSPSLGEEAFHLSFTLAADGVDAWPPAEISRDREAGLLWSRGKHAAKALRAARVAREAAEATARDLLAAYGHGQACGWAGGPKIAPHGYTAARCERFHAGYLAGEADFLAERPDHADGDDSADYGGQIGRALAEDVADRLDRAASGDWSFIG